MLNERVRRSSHATQHRRHWATAGPQVNWPQTYTICSSNAALLLVNVLVMRDRSRYRFTSPTLVFVLVVLSCDPGERTGKNEDTFCLCPIRSIACYRTHSKQHLKRKTPLNTAPHNLS